MTWRRVLSVTRHSSWEPGGRTAEMIHCGRQRWIYSALLVSRYVRLLCPFDLSQHVTRDLLKATTRRFIWSSCVADTDLQLFSASFHGHIAISLGQSKRHVSTKLLNWFYNPSQWPKCDRLLAPLNGLNAIHYFEQLLPCFRPTIDWVSKQWMLWDGVIWYCRISATQSVPLIQMFSSGMHIHCCKQEEGYWMFSRRSGGFSVLLYTRGFL